MNGELAQAAALAAHGRVRLEEPAQAASFSANSTLQFTNSVSFERPRRFLGVSAGLATVAISPDAWFEFLRGQRVESIKLATWSGHQDLPDHTAAAFSGGGCWGVRIESKRSSALWVPRWDVTRDSDPNNRIWSVVYREFQPCPPVELGQDLRSAATELESALDEALAFCHDAEVEHWAAVFQAAIDALSSQGGVVEYHPDLLPESGYSGAARSLTAAVSKAWVFGGMGSWNDAYFSSEDQESRYQSVSAQLYSAVLRAATSAINSPS